MSKTPMWMHQLLDGLADYEDNHPRLFMEFDGREARGDLAGCVMHLLKLVPEDALAASRAFMAGWREGQAEYEPGPSDEEPANHHAGEVAK